MPSTETLKPATDERALIESIRAGDERAFAALVDEYSPSLLGVAMNHVRSRAVAEEVVQETWVGVIRGLDRFEGRSSFRSWIFAILRNTAISKGEREQRTIPMSSLAADSEDEELGLDADRFLGPDHDRYPGHWALGPTRWPLPDEGLLAGETREVIADAINELPPAQRAVITLRDVEGWDSEEVCEMLDISAGNQRVLLHRARSRVRAAIESYFGAVESTLAEA
jgi:RNA polymerase sigma-70 factor (ECF subfamily)